MKHVFIRIILSFFLISISGYSYAVESKAESKADKEVEECIRQEKEKLSIEKFVVPKNVIDKKIKNDCQHDVKLKGKKFIKEDK